MASGRKRGLYYNCDKIFVPGHKCGRQQLFMIMAEEENSREEGTEIEHKNTEIEEEKIRRKKMIVRCPYMP